MKIIPTAIPEVICIEPKVLYDARGVFFEVFRSDIMISAGISGTFVQDNHSGSHRLVLRGLHYQVWRPQGKLVRVISGEIFDVAVDLRRDSSSFGVWVGQPISADNRRMIWIPPGFAHGFLVLSDWADVLYKVTDYYAPEWERTLAWNDPSVAIRWPIPDGEKPILSAKDASGNWLKDIEDRA
jgi:dTDP-4-dehydrorhamnose 3,5-epimerase